MATLKKYDLTGKEIGEVEIGDELLKTSVNGQLIKDYLVALRTNARQWSASTKTRAEVNHSGKKPHPQKGTGRARQGYLGATQYKGGGRVFAPKPKFDQHVRINKKERQAAIRHLLAEKILENNICILKEESLKAPQTKKVHSFLKGCNLVDRKVLFLGLGESEKKETKTKKTTSKSKKSSGNELFIKSMRNIPATQFQLISNINGYDIACSQGLVVLESALDKLMGLLGGKS